jgi:hypothetical protein
MKCYLSSGAVKLILGDVESRHEAARLFVAGLAPRRILEMGDSVLVAEIGFRYRRCKAADSFDLRELLVEVARQRDAQEGGDNEIR